MKSERKSESTETMLQMFSSSWDCYNYYLHKSINKNEKAGSICHIPGNIILHQTLLTVDPDQPIVK